MRNKSLGQRLSSLPKRLAHHAIRFYQLAISPQFPSCCRFTPTCSRYALIAYDRFGFIKGTYLTLRRLLRCRPGGGSGYDPVPEKFHW